MHISVEVSQQLVSQLDHVIKECINQAIKDLVVEDRIMTKKELAEFIQISIPTLETYMREGLPYFQRGQVIRFLYSDVVAWLKIR